MSAKSNSRRGAARPSAKPAASHGVRARHPGAPHFDPVALRARHDGWSPERQLAFIDALAATGCIHEACAAVGISTQSAYRLRMRVDAQAFRLAWDAALDFAIRRLSDEAFSRAINGVVVPHYYQGELIGEHRRYDERLAMFLMRYRDPLRYAATLDRMVYDGHREAPMARLAEARDKVAHVAHRLAEEPLAPDPVPEAAPEPPYVIRPIQQAEAEARARLHAPAPVADEEEDALLAKLRSLSEHDPGYEAALCAVLERALARQDRQAGIAAAGNAPPPDRASPSSPSGAHDP